MTLIGKSIVVIDDEESIRKFLGIYLQQNGAEFHTAATASGGLALCEQIHPHLVVLDLGLPDKEGFNILPELKKSSMQPPAVLVLTARRERHHRDRAIELGADGFLTKPFVLEELIEQISQHIH